VPWDRGYYADLVCNEGAIFFATVPAAEVVKRQAALRCCRVMPVIAQRSLFASTLIAVSESRLSLGVGSWLEPTHIRVDLRPSMGEGIYLGRAFSVAPPPRVLNEFLNIRQRIPYIATQMEILGALTKHSPPPKRDYGDPQERGNFTFT
jgi:hypothetical protein